MQRKTVFNYIIGFSLLGLLVALYQVYEHYFLGGAAICDLSSQLACSPITKSKYGELPFRSGMSLALWGAIWWVGLAGLAQLTKKGKELIRNQEFWVFLYSLAGLAFVGYLLVVELYILPQTTGEIIICPFCTIQHVLILIITFLSYKLIRGTFFRNLKFSFYKGDKIDPKPLFILATLFVVAFGGYFILRPAGQANYYDFAECLAEKNATMYGFDACPHCNAQKALIGKKAFKQEIDNKGFYVRCRPENEARQKLGPRADKLSTVKPLTADTTQREACSMNVGRGTPTWIIDGKKYAGEQSLGNLSKATGCPLPEGYNN